VVATVPIGKEIKATMEEEGASCYTVQPVQRLICYLDITRK